jgi:hypothetical protein
MLTVAASTRVIRDRFMAPPPDTFGPSGSFDALRALGLLRT